MIECWNHVTDFNQQYDQLIINLIDVQRISEIFTSGRDRIYQLPGQVSSIFRSPPWSLISWSIVIGWFRNAFVHFNYFLQASKSANCLFDDGDGADYDDLPPSSTTTLPLPPKLRPPLPPKQKINKSSEVVRAHKFATFPRLFSIYICLSDNSTRKILTSEAKWLSMLFFQYLAINTN